MNILGERHAISYIQEKIRDSYADNMDDNMDELNDWMISDEDNDMFLKFSDISGNIAWEVVGYTVGK